MQKFKNGLRFCIYVLCMYLNTTFFLHKLKSSLLERTSIILKKNPDFAASELLSQKRMLSHGSSTHVEDSTHTGTGKRGDKGPVV